MHLNKKDAFLQASLVRKRRILFYLEERKQWLQHNGQLFKKKKQWIFCKKKTWVTYASAATVELVIVEIGGRLTVDPPQGGSWGRVDQVAMLVGHPDNTQHRQTDK